MPFFEQISEIHVSDDNVSDRVSNINTRLHEILLFEKQQNNETGISFPSSLSFGGV